MPYDTKSALFTAQFLNENPLEENAMDEPSIFPVEDGYGFNICNAANLHALTQYHTQLKKTRRIEIK